MSKKVFAILGVDIDNPKQVSNFQDDLRFASAAKKMMGKSMWRVLMVLLATATAWIVTRIYNG